MKQRILFVCLGNICRSPAAEGILRDLVIRRGLTERIEVDSAGTYAGHTGELADPRMRRAASARGIELTQPIEGRNAREGASFNIKNTHRGRKSLVLIVYCNLLAPLLTYL